MEGLEEKCRQWAEADGAIYIVCGPVMGGNPIEYIGDSRVYVPRKFFQGYYLTLFCTGERYRIYHAE